MTDYESIDLNDINPATKKFLAELTPNDLRDFKFGAKVAKDVAATARVVKWTIIFIAGVLVLGASLIDNFGKVMKYIRGT